MVKVKQCLLERGLWLQTTDTSGEPITVIRGKTKWVVTFDEKGYELVTRAIKTDDSAKVCPDCQNTGHIIEDGLTFNCYICDTARKQRAGSDPQV